MTATAARVRPSEDGTDHAVHGAAERGDLVRVRALVDGDATLVHRGDRAGGTPLHRAVIGRAPSVVELLLDRGADIHAIHGAGLGSASGYAPHDLQPIDLAIWGGPCRVPSMRAFFAGIRDELHERLAKSRRVHDLRTARLLIARGATYDLPTAAALGDIERVTAMLDDNPARIDETRPNRRRPLSAAVEFGHDRIARVLLERGTDPTWLDADESSRGSALHAAARMGNRTLVELLMKHGADPSANVDSAGNATFAAKTRALRALLIAHGGKLEPYDLVWLGEDDLVMKAVRDNPSSAHDGCGGVYTAVCTKGNRKLLMRLLDAGVKVPPVAGGCQSYLLERPDMLRLLLARGGLDPNYPTPEGVTLLHTLCNRDVRGRTMKRRTEVAAILLAAGADISARDKNDSTPLDWAERHQLPDMVEFLRKHGAR